MQKTTIEWCRHPETGLGFTWNPVAMRCTPVSPGCDHCWHLAMCKRHAANANLRPEVRAARAGGAPWLDERELQAPLRRKRPAMIAVQLMGDLFHEDVPEDWLDHMFSPDVPDDWLDRMFSEVMELGPHIYVLLTKRPERMREYLCWRWGGGRIPPSNIWAGISVEDQATFNARWWHLAVTPAVRRIISYEPALGPVNWTPCLNSIDGLWAGGETRAGARPSHPDWFRQARDACARAGVPFLFKGWGAWMPGVSATGTGERRIQRATGADVTTSPGLWDDSDAVMVRCPPKHPARRLLGGRTHEEMPQ